MSDAPAQTGSWASSIYNLGGSIVSYATDTLNYALGYEDLSVVDPDSAAPDGEGTEKGANKVDEGVHQNVREGLIFDGGGCPTMHLMHTRTLRLTGAEAGMGLKAVPAVHWNGCHVAPERPCVDHGAVHYPAEGGRDHGIHRAAGQGQLMH